MGRGTIDGSHRSAHAYQQHTMIASTNIDHSSELDGSRVRTVSRNSLFVADPGAAQLFSSWRAIFEYFCTYGYSTGPVLRRRARKFRCLLPRISCYLDLPSAAIKVHQSRGQLQGACPPPGTLQAYQKTQRYLGALQVVPQGLRQGMGPAPLADGRRSRRGLPRCGGLEFWRTSANVLAMPYQTSYTLLMAIVHSPRYGRARQIKSAAFGRTSEKSNARGLGLGLRIYKRQR